MITDVPHSYTVCSLLLMQFILCFLYIDSHSYFSSWDLTIHNSSNLHVFLPLVHAIPSVHLYISAFSILQTMEPPPLVLYVLNALGSHSLLLLSLPSFCSILCMIYPRLSYNAQRLLLPLPFCLSFLEYRITLSFSIKWEILSSSEDPIDV